MNDPDYKPQPTGHEYIDKLIQLSSASGSEVAATVALTYATLALVEQQRIANLIAYLAICEERGAADATYRALDFNVRGGLGL